MLPVMTQETREKAAAARKAAADARADLRSGRITITDVLDGHVPALAKAKVRLVLADLPGIGKTRALQLLAAAGVAADRRDSVRFRGLGPNQRAALRQALAP
jgi:transposase